MYIALIKNNYYSFTLFTESGVDNTSVRALQSLNPESTVTSGDGRRKILRGDEGAFGEEG